MTRVNDPKANTFIIWTKWWFIPIYAATLISVCLCQTLKPAGCYKHYNASKLQLENLTRFLAPNILMETAREIVSEVRECKFNETNLVLQFCFKRISIWIPLFQEKFNSFQLDPNGIHLSSIFSWNLGKSSCSWLTGLKDPFPGYQCIEAVINILIRKDSFG